MANKDPQSTTDVFRFVSARAVNTPEKDALNRRYVTCELSDQEIQTHKNEIATALRVTANNENDLVKAVSNGLLTKSLPKLKGYPEAEALMIRQATLFFNQSNLLLKPEAFAQKYPDLYHVYLWHRDTNNERTITKNELKAKIEAALQELNVNSISDFLKRKDYFVDKLVLWENVVAHYIIPKDVSLRANIVNMIRWFWIMERLTHERDSLADGQAIYEALNATVILPDDVLHHQPRVQKDPEPRTRELLNHNTADLDVKRLKELSGAVTELSAALETQNLNERYSERLLNNAQRSLVLNTAVPDSDHLARRYVDELSATTHVVLEALGIPKGSLRVPLVLERLNGMIRDHADNLAGRETASVVVNINGRIIQIDNACHHYESVDPCARYEQPTLPKGCGLANNYGVADLKVVRTTLLKYELGEIAHIENVLKGEKKVREFNTLKRTEETLFTEEESTTENEKETQTTDRFELEKESSNVVKEDMKFDTGVKVSAKLGVVNLDSHLDFAYNKSKEEASKTATKYAQEVMNRALSRVIEKKRTQRTVTTIIQTEDKNSHTLDNTSVTGGTPTDNIAGTYRWVDKLYLAKVVNYGKRLMFEFVVPEPAAFYLYSKANKPQDGNAILKPLYPSKFSAVKYVSTGGKESTEPLASFKDITVSNYAALAAKYNAQDVVPPPPSLKIVTTEVKYDRPAETKTDKDDESYKGDKYFTITSKELKIPPGYKAKHADVSFKRPPGFIMGPLGTGGVFTERLSILIGNKQLTNYDDQNNFTEFSSPQWMIPLNIEDDTVPLSIIGSANHFIANVEVICDVTQEKLDEWRKDTFNSIIAAYYARLEEYKNWLRQQNTAAGIVISGNNPLANRETEREELKKHCIEIISGQRFETFDAMRSNVERGYPEFSFNEATAEGSYVQFFEQAFEWEQITYVFYPYFWGRKPNWIMVKNIEDTDPLFTNFLQAGAARVLVPTRLGFETDVIHYFASNGEIWHGKDAPIPSDERWISIVDEIKEQQGQFEGGVQHGDPWVIKMPTSLVYLEKVNSPLPDLSATFKDDLAKIKPAW